jgi:TPR repeat protein
MRPTYCAVALGIAACAAQAAPPEDVYEQGLALYERGYYRQALAAVSDAAEQGHVRAQEMAGLMHLAGPVLYGDQVARDEATGRAWLARAAHAGSEMARRIACAGSGVPRAECATDRHVSTQGVSR